MNTTLLPRRTIIAAGIASAVLQLTALSWLVWPGHNPYQDPAVAQIRAVLSVTAHAWVLTGIALVGTVSAAVAVARPEAARAVRVIAPALALGLFAATTGLSGLAFAGYLVGMALPLVAGVAGAVAAIRSRRARLPLLVALVVGAGILVTFGSLVRAALWHNLVAFAATAPQLWALLTTLTATALWSVLTVRTVQASGPVRRLTPWLVRHRRALTVLAALGPLPYSLVRLTWLTPWPLARPEGGDDVITAWGLMLSLGGWMGAVLTLGLILPWGERFPHWMPRIGGRPVPPAAAIVPGSIVAGLLCLAAVPWTVSFVQHPSSEFAPYFFLLPVGYWGVLLALAVWAYAGHRAGGGGPGQAAGPSPDPAGWAAPASEGTMVR